MTRQKVSFYLSLLLLTLVATVVFVLDFSYLPQGDDTVYGAFLDSAGNISKISSVVEAFHRSFIVDGHRPVVHFLARVFCFNWLAAFPYFNAAMVVLLLLLIVKNAFGRIVLEFNAVSVLCFLYLLVLCTGETTVFIAGSCNYLWTAVATLAFMLVCKRLFNDEFAFRDLVWAVPFAFLVGWMQESFTLTVGFAIFVLAVSGIRKMNVRKFLVFGAYAIGFLCLIMGNVRLHDPSVSQKPIALFCGFGDIVRFMWSTKLLLIVGVLWLFVHEKKQFIVRNAFELLVMLGSLLSVVFLGFYGERMVYIANICGLVILLREFIPNVYVSTISTGLFLALSVAVLCINSTVSANAKLSVDTYCASHDGVYCTEKIGYPLWRFYFQDFPTWGDRSDCHKMSVSMYYAGVTNKIPIGLSRRLYTDLYLKDTYCNPDNRIRGIDVEAYTTPDLNAIVIPLTSKDQTDWTQHKFLVVYDDAGGIIQRIADKWHQWHDIEIQPKHPVELKTDFGRFLLLGKRRGCETRIRAIKID